MIVLDTHIWMWWIDNHERLTPKLRDHITQNQKTGLGISVISCWEIAKLVEKKQLNFSRPVAEWITKSLSVTGVQLLDLSPQIVIESTQLPGEFHRDPADQIIVATARVLDLPLLTVDAKILAYPYVKTLK